MDRIGTLERANCVGPAGWPHRLELTGRLLRRYLWELRYG